MNALFIVYARTKSRMGPACLAPPGVIPTTVKIIALAAFRPIFYLMELVSPALRLAKNAIIPLNVYNASITITSPTEAIRLALLIV